MFTFKETSQEELLDLLKAEKFDKFADELSKSYANEMLNNSDLTESDSYNSDTEDNGNQPEKNADNRTHLLSFRVNDEELKKIEDRFSKSGFQSKGEYFRFTAMNSFIFNENKAYSEKISKDISGIARNINQVVHRVNSTKNIYADDIIFLKKGVEEVWQLLASMLSKRELVQQLNISLTQQKPMTAFWLLLIYVIQNRTKSSVSFLQSVTELAEEKLQLKHST